MPRRRITKGRIKHISLVPKGANKLPVIYKDDGAIEVALLTKATADFDERGEVLGVVYAPDLEDSQGDIASREVIRDMMHGFAKEGEGIDIRHDGKVLEKDQAFVAESFEIQKGDERFEGMKTFDGKAVDVAGGWGVVIKIEDDGLRKKYRSGTWSGLSMGGTAEVQALKSDDGDEAAKTGWLRQVFEALGVTRPLNKTSNLRESGKDEIDMDAKEFSTLLEKNNDALAEKIAKAIADSSKKDEPIKKDEPSAFEKAKKEKLIAKQAEIIEEIDWTDDASVEDGMEKCEKLQALIDGKPMKKAGVRKSNALRGEGSRNDGPETLVDIGKDMARRANEANGMALPSRERERDRSLVMA